jgi:hypothetical protein
MKFAFLTGDVNWLNYGGKWISPKLNNGDFDYWIVMELINMDDACGRDNEGQAKYHVSLAAVSPSQAGEHLNRALDSCGIGPQHQGGVFVNVSEVMAVEALHSYGVSAPLWQSGGNNARKLLREASKQAQMTNMLFGFYMDAPKNKIGTTGWEAIKGDLDSALHRTIASGSTEGRILAKMYSVAAPQ